MGSVNKHGRFPKSYSHAVVHRITLIYQNSAAGFVLDAFINAQTTW